MTVNFNRIYVYSLMALSLLVLLILIISKASILYIGLFFFLLLESFQLFTNPYIKLEEDRIIIFVSSLRKRIFPIDSISDIRFDDRSIYLGEGENRKEIRIHGFMADPTDWQNFKNKVLIGEILEEG